MSGGSVVAFSVEDLTQLGCELNLTFPEGLESTVGQVALAWSKASLLQRSISSSLFGFLEPAIKRKFGEVGVAEVLKGLEDLLRGPPKDRLTALEVLTDVHQLAKNTVLFQVSTHIFPEASPVSPSSNSVGYLTSLGLLEHQAAEVANIDKFRQFVVDVCLLGMWAVVATIALAEQVHGATPRLSATAAVDNIGEADARLPFPQAVPQPPVADTQALVTAVAEMQRMLLQLAGTVTSLQRNQQQPAPLVGGQGMQAPPVNTALSAGGRNPPEIVDIYAEEDDPAEDDLRSFACEERNLEHLKAGVQNMTGESYLSPTFPVLSHVTPSGSAAAASYWDGPRLRDDLARLQTEYITGVEVTLDQVTSALLAPDGLIIMTVQGLPVTIAHAVSHKAPMGNQKIITRRYNPDGDSVINRTPAQQIPAHAFPATVDQLVALLREQLSQALLLSPLFRGTAPTVIINTIIAYERKILRLIDGLFGGHTSATVQQHRHHVTMWTVVALFHHNRWMRAMVHGHIQALLEGFDTTWQAVYLVQLGLDSDGLPLVQLQEALTFLGYRCPRCNRLGACAVFCTHDACRASKVGPPTQGAAKTAKPPGYMKAYRTWLATQTSLTDTKEAHKRYASSADYKTHGFTEVAAKGTAVPSAGMFTSCQDAANSQQHIRLHICPNFHY